ncbi:hypothetical protein [Jeotgalibacillus campisalis]|uniref:hypothetical protein n=1 Tax=Jeotgalibacillus campisalis TaxID=220754 RepID=UPI000596B792|nr:hypothetical protein [Jeotgalibacillus campisalis]
MFKNQNKSQKILTILASVCSGLAVFVTLNLSLEPLKAIVSIFINSFLIPLLIWRIFFYRKSKEENK